MPRSTSTKGLPDPVFWVDENLGSPRFVSALRVAGLQIAANEFPEGTLDIEWLPVIAANGWVAITKDQLKEDLEEQIALIRYNAKVFVLIGSASHADLAALFLRKLRWVKRQVAEQDGGFLGKIYVKSGEAKVVSITDLCSRSSRRWGRR